MKKIEYTTTPVVAANNGHGGARAGAGRKPGSEREPRPRRYEAFCQEMERFMILHLPAIIEVQMEKALNGHDPSARFIADRILGRPSTNKESPVESSSLSNELLTRLQAVFQAKRKAGNSAQPIAAAPAIPAPVARDSIRHTAPPHRAGIGVGAGSLPDKWDKLDENARRQFISGALAAQAA